MKLNDDLLNKFNSIEDLPVSEEMLCAYEEGTLSKSEMEMVRDEIESNSALLDLLEEDGGISPFSEDEYDDSDINSIIESLDLDALLDFADTHFFDNSEIFLEDNDRYLGLEDSLEIDDNSNNIQDMETNQNSIGVVYGEPTENITDPVYILQPDDHSCALRSQQIVLRDFGIDIPFKDLEKLALENGVYSEDGTAVYDVGKVLELAGVGMHQVQGCSMQDLANELAQGHRVIVGVDADELWHNNAYTDKFKNWLNDIGGGSANHALIVAGIEVNPSNPNDVQVVLTDTGSGDLRIAYPMNQFMDAWKDSNCFMAATNEAAPFQYDAATGKEIPSNFAVQQFVNEFVANNGYQLNPDMINVPDSYVAAYDGHIDMVGDVDYATFENNYCEFLDNRFPSSLTIKEQMEDAYRSSHDSHNLSMNNHQSDETLWDNHNNNEFYDDTTFISHSYDHTYESDYESDYDEHHSEEDSDNEIDLNNDDFHGLDVTDDDQHGDYDYSDDYDAEN